MRLADRAIVSVMTPRTDVDRIDITASERDFKERHLPCRMPLAVTPDQFLEAMVNFCRLTRIKTKQIDGEPYLMDAALADVGGNRRTQPRPRLRASPIP